MKDLRKRHALAALRVFKYKVRLLPLVHMMVGLAALYLVLTASRCEDEPDVTPSDQWSTFEFMFYEQDSLKPWPLGFQTVSDPFRDASTHLDNYMGNLDLPLERVVASNLSLSSYIFNHALKDQLGRTRYKRHLFTILGFNNLSGEPLSLLGGMTMNLASEEDWGAFVAAGDYQQWNPDLDSANIKLAITSSVVHELGHMAAPSIKDCNEDPNFHDRACVMMFIVQLRYGSGIWEIRLWCEDSGEFFNHTLDFCSNCITEIKKWKSSWP